MNWRTILVIFFAVSLSIISFANADSGSTYGGLSVGSALPEGNALDNAVGWKIFVGYEINNKIAIEGGYTSFGEMDGPSKLGFSTSVESTGFELALIERYPINHQLEFFLKLGLLDWDFKVNNVDSGSSSTTGRDIFFGLGWEYDLLGNWGVRGTWDRYKIEGDNIDLLSGSLVYSFK